jgi:hypothetical protein
MIAEAQRTRLRRVQGGNGLNPRFTVPRVLKLRASPVREQFQRKRAG